MITARPSWMLAVSAILLGIVACEDMPESSADSSLTVQSGLTTAKQAPATTDVVMMGDLAVTVMPKARPPQDVLDSRATGTCEAAFDIDAGGKATGTVVTCDNDVFVPTVEAAMATARFAPKIVDGTAVPQTGKTMPFSFETID